MDRSNLAPEGNAGTALRGTRGIRESGTCLSFSSPPIRDQVEKRVIHWATYEYIFEHAIGLPPIDLLDRTGIGALDEKLDEVAGTLETQIRTEVAPGAP